MIHLVNEFKTTPKLGYISTFFGVCVIFPVCLFIGFAVGSPARHNQSYSVYANQSLCTPRQTNKPKIEDTKNIQTDWKSKQYNQK